MTVLRPYDKPAWIEGPDGTKLPFQPVLQLDGSAVTSVTNDPVHRRTVAELAAGGGGGSTPLTARFQLGGGNLPGITVASNAASLTFPAPDWDDIGIGQVSSFLLLPKGFYDGYFVCSGIPTVGAGSPAGVGNLFQFSGKVTMIQAGGDAPGSANGGLSSYDAFTSVIRNSGGEYETPQATCPLAWESGDTNVGQTFGLGADAYSIVAANWDAYDLPQDVQIGTYGADSFFAELYIRQLATKA